METITFTLPLGITLDSPINDLERAIYPQHRGLALLIGRIDDAQREVAAMEDDDEREADEAIRVRDAALSALETLCDAVDDFDEAIDATGNARSMIGDELGALLSASETARGQL